jgi:hypothetical protein
VCAHSTGQIGPQRRTRSISFAWTMTGAGRWRNRQLDGIRRADAQNCKRHSPMRRRLVGRPRLLRRL